MSYNGYANYETWAVALWIDNDQGLYSTRLELVQEAVNDEEEPYQIGQRLKDWVNDSDNGIIPDLGATLASDLLSAALSEVDWTELAEHWMDEADKPEPEEDEDTDATVTA